MIVSGKYELAQAVPGTNLKSFHGRHVVTGRTLMVHFVSGIGAIDDVLSSLSDEARAQLIDAGEYEGEAFLVTAPILGFTTLRAWIGVASTAVSAPPTPSPTPSAANDRPSTGEFEEFLGRKPPSPLPASSVPAATAPADEPTGTFAQLFSTPLGEAPKPAPPAPAAHNPGDDPSFTQMFAVPNSPPPSRPVAPSQASPPREESSFTEVFRAAPQPSAVPPPPLTLPRTPGEPSFTDAFPALSKPSAPAWPATPASADVSDATHIFAARPGGPAHAPPPADPIADILAGSKPAAPAPVNPVPTPPLPPAKPRGDSADLGATAVFEPVRSGLATTAAPLPPSSSGPGEFTQIIQGRGGSAPGPSAPASASDWPFTPAMPSAVPSAMPAVSLPRPPAAPAMPQAPKPPAAPAVPAWAANKGLLVGLLSFVLMLAVLLVIYLLRG